jgi:hypothetical protein
MPGTIPLREQRDNNKENVKVLRKYGITFTVNRDEYLKRNLKINKSIRNEF